jgi:hypothetical protein
MDEQLGAYKSNRREGFEEHEEAEQIRTAAVPELAGSGRGGERRRRRDMEVTRERGSCACVWKR